MCACKPTFYATSRSRSRCQYQISTAKKRRAEDLTDARMMGELVADDFFSGRWLLKLLKPWLVVDWRWFFCDVILVISCYTILHVLGIAITGAPVGQPG